MICNLRTPKTPSINIGSPVGENFSACHKVLRHACAPTVCTHVFSAFHHGHGVFPHPSGATVATVRSMSLRSSLLRAACSPGQTPLVDPLDSSERTFCQYTNANFHRKKSADMLEKSAHLTVLAIVPIASFEANTEHGILPHFLKRNRHK